MTMINPQDALGVACPKCDARPQEPCAKKTKVGAWKELEKPHKERFKAAQGPPELSKLLRF